MKSADLGECIIATRVSRKDLFWKRVLALFSPVEMSSCWLVTKARVDPKTVQSMLRHAKIQTTLDLYTYIRKAMAPRRGTLGAVSGGARNGV